MESRTALDTYRTALTRDGDPNLSTLFAAVNFGKRSITIDLKSASAREVMMKLISTADVVVENFSSGTMERLGYGYSVLAPGASGSGDGLLFGHRTIRSAGKERWGTHLSSLRLAAWRH